MKAPPRILIVENEQIVALDLQARLENLGYQVIDLVATGAAAVNTAIAAKPDLVLMDIMLDGAMDGVQAATTIREKLRIPVVYVTAYSDAETLARAKIAEPFGFIHKPIEQRELHATLEIALYKQAIDRRLAESEQKYRSMMEAMNDLVYICSPDCRIEYMNPAMVRKIGQEIIGAPCHQIFYGYNQPCAWCARDQVKAGRTAHWEVTHPVDQSVWRAVATPLRHLDGSLSMMVFMTDITARKRTEQALQEGEARYRRLVESISDYTYTVKVENGRAVSTAHGPACKSVTGYSSEEYAADSNLWFKMVHIDDRATVLQQAERVLAGQTIQPLEHRIIHKNGQIRWIRNTPVPHRDGSGRLVAYDGTVADITERKRAEEQIKEHARRLEIINRVIAAVNKAADLQVLLEDILASALELLHFNGGGIYLANPDRGAAALVCSKNMPADCRPPLDLSGAFERLVLAEGQALFIDDYRRLAAENARRWNVAAVAKVPLISKDQIIGALVMLDPAAHQFSEEEKNILQSMGRQIGLAIAKMRSEAALRESESKYRTISEQSLIGIHIIKDGRFVYVNEGWMKILGYSRADIAAWGPEADRALIQAEDRAFFMEQVRRKQAGQMEGVVPVYDCRFIAKSGETKWVSLHSRAVSFADGLAIVGVIVDITDRKLAEEALAAANRQLKAREQELLEANREKEVLLKEIHHRVKNNLQVISSLLKLQLGHTQDQKAVQVIQACQSRIKSIAIVHEKLYQSRNLAQIDLGEYIDILTRHLARMYLADPGTIRIQTTVAQVALGIDQAIPCSLIVNELVSNSLKYAFPQNQPGEIRVQLRACEAGKLVLTVSDNGVGWPPGLDFRNTSSLGLQLVMTFVEQLGGMIELGPPPGTAFTITFAEEKRKKERAET